MNIEDEILGNPILREVKGLLENQTAKGLAKYGTTVNPYDYTFDEWIRHAQEECMDLLVYLTLLKNKNKNHVSAELYEDLVSDYQKLQNENKRLRETLEFYADDDNYYEHPWADTHIESDVQRDGGQKAQEALEELNNGLR